MSTTRKRRPRSSGSSFQQTVGGGGPQHVDAARVSSLPVWHWRTFPVYFAFAVGGFLGLYMGVLVQAANNSWATLVVFSFWAVLVGWGPSRMTTRWLVGKNWAPATRRANKRR